MKHQPELAAPGGTASSKRRRLRPPPASPRRSTAPRHPSQPGSSSCLGSVLPRLLFSLFAPAAAAQCSRVLRRAPTSGATVDHGPDSMARVDARPGPLPCRAGAWPAPPASSPLMPERSVAPARGRDLRAGAAWGGSPGGEVGAQLHWGWCKEPPLPDAGVRRFVGAGMGSK